MKLLCLCRAPLDYYAGIPKFCLDLFSCPSFNRPILASVSLGSDSTLIKKNHTDFQELIFPSFLSFKTISISFQFFSFIFNNLSKFTAIHYNHPDPFAALCIIFHVLFKGKKNKLCVTWHAEVYRSYLAFSPILFAIDLFLFLIADFVVYPSSHHMSTSLLYKFGFVRRKSLIIPLALSSTPAVYKSRSIQKILIGPQKLNLLSIGRLVTYKGYCYSIRAVRHLIDKFPNLCLSYVIVGSGPLYKELSDLVSSIGLNNFVYFESNIPESRKKVLLDQSDIFLFPSISRSEAFGISQLEAMSFSLPVINTNLGNGVNFVAPSDVAYTVDIKNSFQISQAIEHILMSDKVFDKFSKASYQRSLDFDVKFVRKSYLRAFL